MREKGTAATLLVGIPAGLLLGVSLFTFGYARGHSYLTDDPAACVNCHPMREQFEGWIKSSHRSAAVCNDCHTPADPVGKYAIKVLNGFNHSWAFTRGRFPDAIRMRSRNQAVTRASCSRCHQDIVVAMGAGRHPREGVECLECHRDVGHAH